MRYANDGAHSYKLPNVLIGMEMRLHGEHRENGVVVCSGAVNVKIAGSIWSNPLSYAGIGGLVIAGGMLFVAGRPAFHKIWTYYDEPDPG